jgi:DNA-binding LacI/PurR family transcriptional regulator
MAISSKQPRYLQIADVLRDQIRSGALETGDRLPSFIEMYREYGATTATMQKVYDLLEKEALIERRSRSGVYVTNAERIKTGIVALVIPRFGFMLGPAFYMETAYAMKMLHGMHERALDFGLQITLCTTEQVQTSEQNFDGLIIHGDQAMIEECAKLGKPMVSLISHPEGVSSVGVDDFEGFYTLTKYLWNEGHRRIALMVETAGNEDDLVSPLRAQGYRQALEELGGEASATWHRTLHDYVGQPGYANWGYQEMSQWLREGWSDLGCTALMTQNDAVAIGVIKALRKHGYRVPQDVSVTGYDNASDNWHFDLKLTTVDVPLDNIGREAVSLLAEQISNSTIETKTIKFPTQIIEGESTSKNTQE